MRPGAMPGLAVATVTQIDDPEKLGRVRVTYPWLDESLETEWISMVAPFAGKDRGTRHACARRQAGRTADASDDAGAGVGRSSEVM